MIYGKGNLLPAYHPDDMEREWVCLSCQSARSTRLAMLTGRRFCLTCAVEIFGRKWAELTMILRGENRHA